MFQNKKFYVFIDGKINYWKGFFFQTMQRIEKRGFYSNVNSNDIYGSNNKIIGWVGSVTLFGINDAVAFNTLEDAIKTANGIAYVIDNLLRKDIDEKNIETCRVDYKIITKNEYGELVEVKM